jgi:two-component system nitrogen regulation response regulator GlnG
LIIEDDAAIRHLLRTCLEDAGYAVKEAENGRDGAKEFRNTHIDLVITDIFMPDCDGLEIIPRLRKLRPNVKILVISGGSGTMDYLKEARMLGAARAIYKPFEIRAILQHVAELLALDTASSSSAKAS